MTKKIRLALAGAPGAAAIAVFATWAAFADPITQWDKAAVGAGGSTNDACPGLYTAVAKMTNSAGSTWLTPATNTSSGTFTDNSSFPPPYSSLVIVTRFSDRMSWCATNHVTFPATNTMQYQLVVYVKSATPPPTNNQPLNLQVQWQ
jgi:hypothetical protein